MNAEGHVTCGHPYSSQRMPQHFTSPPIANILHSSAYGMYERPQTAHRYKQSTRVSWHGRRYTILQGTTLRKVNGRLSAASLARQDQKKTHNPKDFSSRENKKNGADTSLEKFLESFKISSQAYWWRFSLLEASQNPGSKNWGRWLLLQIWR